MNTLNDKIDSISNISEHYLIKAKNTNHKYFADFLGVAKVLNQLLTKSEFDVWCTEKMQLKQQAFIEKTFIQYAVETSIVKFFGENFPTGFKVELKINPSNKKDVDCQFSNNGYTYNVEVKCADYSTKEAVENSDAIKYSTAGRLPDRGAETIKILSSAIDEGMTNKGESIKPHSISKNMDNNLKDFLELAHEKFIKTNTEDDVNVLIVGCDDDNDIQCWINYLFAEEGLFTNRTFADKDKYRNVDIVVLTNLYYKHNKYYNKEIESSWDFGNGFNLVICNPFRHSRKEKAIANFADLLPNCTKEFDNYVVPGSAPNYVKEVVKVRWFVKDYLEKEQGIYFFSKQEGENNKNEE